MKKEKRPKGNDTIYLVPHTHYDVVWAFNKEDYFLIFTSILQKAIEMIGKGDFKFLIEQTYPLEVLEHRNPELFARVEKAVQEGHIEIVDGQYLMPDYMIPGGEVLVRGILRGKRYCREKFGVDVPVAWAADGFGLNAQLPQIYRKSGYRFLAFRRGLPRSIGSRVSEFVWQGIDGSRILSHWMPLGYRAGLWLDKWEESYRRLAELATTRHILMPCGSGGSIPQEDIPEKLRQWNEGHPGLPMVMATPIEFFEGLENDSGKLTTFKGELYSDDLERIFPDVASSRVRLRLAIRDRELELIMAEKAAALALLSGKPYPADALDEAWRKKLFLVMHDVVPGCGIDEIYEEAWNYIEDLHEDMPPLQAASIKHIMRGDERGLFLIVFNPNNWSVENWVEADIELAEGWTDEPGITWKGKEIPSEALEIVRWDDGSVSRARIGFMASVPPLGCRAYGVRRKTKNFRNNVKIKENQVENRFFKLSIDDKTGIVTVLDHEGGVLLTGNEIIIDEELGDLYFHRNFLDKHIGTEGGEGLHFGIFKPQPVRIEKDAIRTVITFQNSYYCLRWPYYLIEKYDPLLYRHKTVDITKRVIIYKDIPRIDFETHLDLLQPHVQISVRFDTGMVAPRYARQTQFGVLEQNWRKSLRGSIKIPSLSWITAQEDGRGLAFLTLGVPINEIRGGEIFCTLLRSVSVLSSDGTSGPLIPTPEAQELGEHSYKYSVYPYQGDWREAGVHRVGFEINQPLRAMQVDNVPRRMEWGSFTLEPENLILSALKRSEEGDALIFRFFETCGQKCRARLGLPDSITGAHVVDLMEKEEAPLDLRDGVVEIDVKPFEIVSLKLRYR